MNSNRNSMHYPISSLSYRTDHNWVIRARVRTKTKMQTKADGECKWFSVDLMDESGEIRATMFNEWAEKFFDVFQMDKVYYISCGRVESANKKYNRLKHDFELVLKNKAIVQKCDEMKANSVPQIKYEFRPIAEIVYMRSKEVLDLDVIGVCKEIGNVVRFMSMSTDRECVTRDLTLVDNINSKESIVLTLWDNDAESFAGFGQPIIMVRSALVQREFNGVNKLSLGRHSQMSVIQDMPEIHKLRGCFDNGGAELAKMVNKRR